MSKPLSEYYEAYSPDRSPKASDRIVVAGPLRGENDPALEGITQAQRRERVSGMVGSVLGLAPDREGVYYVWHPAQIIEELGSLAHMGPGIKAYTGDELLRINLDDEA